VRGWLAEAEYAIISSDGQIVASNFIGDYESYVREIWAVHGQALKPGGFTFVGGVEEDKRLLIYRASEGSSLFLAPERHQVQFYYVLAPYAGSSEIS